MPEELKQAVDRVKQQFKKIREDMKDVRTSIFSRKGLLARLRERREKRRS